MSTIQDKLNKLKPYVVGIRYAEDILVVEAVFKAEWVTPTSNIIKSAPIEEGGNHLVIYSQAEGIGVDELLDYVESIIKINTEREQKHEYLKTKVKELQILFSKNSLNKLKTLKFVLGSESFITDNMEPEDILNQIEPVDNIPSTDTENVNEPEIKSIIEVEDITHKIEEPIQTTKKIGNKPIVELPPKGKKIEVEIHELPVEMTTGPCNCGPDEYCPKCMDGKGM
jgi:hypothetical protein